MTATVPRITSAAAPRRSRRRASAAVLVVVAVCGAVPVGIGLGRASVDPTPGSARAAPSSGGAPAAAAGGPVGVGWARTRAGAVGAATAYVAALNARAAVVDPVRRAGLVRSVVVAGQREEAAEASAVRVGPGGPGELFAAAFADPRSSAWRLVPVGHRLDSFTGSAAVVAVWTVQVIAGVGAANVPATALWATTTVVLVWAEGDWKLDLAATGSALGPAPGLGRLPLSSDLDVVAADQTFAEYDHLGG